MIMILQAPYDFQKVRRILPLWVRAKQRKSGVSFMTLLEKINWTVLKIVQEDCFSFYIVFSASLRIQQKFDLLEEFDSDTQCWKKQTNKLKSNDDWVVLKDKLLFSGFSEK